MLNVRKWPLCQNCKQCKAQISLHIWTVCSEHLGTEKALIRLCRWTDWARSSLFALHKGPLPTICTVPYYPKYSDISTPYHTCSKILSSTIYYLMWWLTLMRCCILWRLIWVYTDCSGLSVQFFFFFDLGFTALSRIFHIYWADRSLKVGENRRTLGKKNTWPFVSRTWLSHMWPERNSNHVPCIYVRKYGILWHLICIARKL